MENAAAHVCVCVCERETDRQTETERVKERQRVFSQLFDLYDCYIFFLI